MKQLEIPLSENPRGIPQAPFIENVEDYATTTAEAQTLFQNLQEMLSKYQFMQNSTQQKALNLKAKIPDMQKTLDMVQLLDSKKDDLQSEPLEVSYELNDTLYAKAKVDIADPVYIWLGANVMLEYSIEEALELLTSKLTAAKKALTDCEEDLEYLRENITTMEVNTARVYNFDVQLRRQEKDASESGK